MTNLEKYNDIFKECFQLEETVQLESLNNEILEDWDSVGHMNLIALLEDTFEIMLESDDIMDFTSYEKGKNILSKYDISFL